MGDRLGAGPQGANQVGPRNEGAHLVCAELGVVVLLDPWGAVGAV